MAREVKSLVGRSFGLLTVVERAENLRDDVAVAGRAAKTHVRWWCVCRCHPHRRLIVRAQCLLGGNVQSCGCLRKELSARRAKERAAEAQAKRYRLDRAEREKEPAPVASERKPWDGADHAARNLEAAWSGVAIAPGDD